MRRGYIFFLCACLSVAFFAWTNAMVNVAKYERETYRTVEHPDFIPSAAAVRLASSGFVAFTADMYWLRTIQYVGNHASGGEYRRYLAAMANLVTDLAPKFVTPYELSVTLLPSLRARDPAAPQEGDRLRDAIALGKKWLAVLCDAEKVAAVAKSTDLSRLATDPATRDPCESYSLPLLVGYAYSFYADDPAAAVPYYRLSAAHSDAPSGIRTLVTTLVANAGDHAASARMLLGLASDMRARAPFCADVADTLSAALGKLAPDTSYDPALAGLTAKLRNLLDERSDHSLAFDTCREYVDRFSRALNLIFVTRADARFSAEKNRHARDALELSESGYLPVLPEDFDRLPDGTPSVYVYAAKENRWLVRFGTYERFRSGEIRIEKDRY